jgi:hypothetical protein
MLWARLIAIGDDNRLRLLPFIQPLFQPFDRQDVDRDELDRQNFHRALRRWRS